MANPHANSRHSALSSPPMSPKSVSLQVGLVKSNHLNHRYQIPFAELLAYIMPPLFFPPACQLGPTKHQNRGLLV
ncbi:unnamed protein product [Protopolystoma xenopodis]|uniref:Uncharacterized protein n=1 Tax=Protopolystoma xenopodis TaxID=117903 RepID=A0A448WFC1_9PLAT|nr:unnamed protein product [Protopolystoma xenopodis]